MKKDKNIVLRVTLEQKEIIEKLALDDYTSLSNVIKRALCDYAYDIYSDSDYTQKIYKTLLE